MFKNLILPASLMAGTIIGAGIFVLPFVFSQAGILTGIFYLVFLTFVVCLIHLMYSEIIIRTKTNYRFVGYASFYLGKLGRWLAVFSTIFGSFITLAIYLILSVSFINLIAPQIADNFKILIFWFLGSLFLFLGVNRLATTEFLIMFGIAVIILIIFGCGLLSPLNLKLFSLINWPLVFLPFGPILFSLAGRTAVPTTLGYFRNNNKPVEMAKKPIIWGTLIPSMVYLVFVAGILGLTVNPSMDSVSGLINKVPFWILALLGILGILSLWSSYIVIGRDVKKSFEHDLFLPPISAGIIVSILPIFIYFSGFRNFLALTEIAGGIFVGLESLLIVLMYKKAIKNPIIKGTILPKINPAIICFFIFVFIAGMAYKLLI